MVADGGDPTSQKPRSPFYAFDNGTGRGKLPLDEQAKIVKELGYDGIGYTGTQRIPEMLKALDARGLKMFSVYVGACVDAGKVPDDPGLKRRIVVAKSGSDSTVVWNPWTAKAARMPDFDDDEWPGMLCVETVNAEDNAVTVAPGACHTMEARISVE